MNMSEEPEALLQCLSCRGEYYVPNPDGKPTAELAEQTNRLCWRCCELVKETVAKRGKEFEQLQAEIGRLKKLLKDVANRWGGARAYIEQALNDKPKETE